MKRHTKILIGLIAGAITGAIVHALWPGAAEVEWTIKNVAYPLGQVFLRLIFMVVVPLVFSSLVLGVLEVGDLRQLGRVGIKALVYSLFTSTTSVVIGIGLVAVIRPGATLDPTLREELQRTFASQTQTQVANAQAAKPFAEALLSLIPKNPPTCQPW